jgi:hypothetical protein
MTDLVAVEAGIALGSAATSAETTEGSDRRHLSFLLICMTCDAPVLCTTPLTSHVDIHGLWLWLNCLWYLGSRRDLPLHILNVIFVAVLLLEPVE